MAGFLRFLAFFLLLVALLVLVVLPLALGPLLTQTVRDLGLRSQTLEVTVAPFDPFLVLGRSRRVNLVAEDIDMPPATVGRAQIALIDASFFERRFDAVEGTLSDVQVTVGGDSIRASEIAIDGPADAATATARLSPDEAERLVRVAAARAGLSIDDVRVTDSGVTVVVSGLEATSQLRVTGGALLLEPEIGGQIVLIQPAPSDAWQLQEAWVTAEGLNLRGEVDVTSLVEEMGG